MSKTIIAGHWKSLIKRPIGKIAVLLHLSASLVILLSVLSLMSAQLSLSVHRLVFTLIFVLGVAICAYIQILYKNSLATFYVAAGIIMAALIASGNLVPNDLCTLFKEVLPDKLNTR